MHASSTTRATFCFWITLLAVAALAISSPVPEPDPAPIDPALSAVVASNVNLGCQNGCSGSLSAQQLNTNAALGSAVSPLSVFGGLVLASGILAAI